MGQAWYPTVNIRGKPDALNKPDFCFYGNLGAISATAGVKSK